MKKIFIVSLLFTLLVTACAPAAASPTSAPPIQAPATSAPATMESTTAPAEASTAQVPVTGSAAKIALSNSSSLGPILVDDRGMTLYLFQKDEPGTSNCYDKCAASWPPLLTSGAPVAGDGIDGSLLGTTTRKDGGTQATYNGWPLYYFAKDSQPGDVKGQGVGNVWYVITPSGQAGPAQAAAPTMPATPATNPAYQY